MRVFTASNLTLIAISIALSGCIIQSRQLNGLLELITEPPMDLSTNSWLVRYSDYESVVFAVSTAKGTLFTNKAGDHILFDGWMVREVSGFGQRSLDIKIKEVDGVRTFQKGARILVSHTCQEWKRETNSGIVRLSQNCGDRRDYRNSILVLEDGSISVIRQIVDERYTALKLTKLE